MVVGSASLPGPLRAANVKRVAQSLPVPWGTVVLGAAVLHQGAGEHLVQHGVKIIAWCGSYVHPDALCSYQDWLIYAV